MKEEHHFHTPPVEQRAHSWPPDDRWIGIGVRLGFGFTLGGSLAITALIWITKGLEWLWSVVA